MNNKQDYINDLAQIRSLMERSSRFLSLSGWSGIMAGVYALTGVYLAHTLFQFQPTALVYDAPANFQQIVVIAITVLLFTLATAIVLSYRKAAGRGEPFWNIALRRLLENVAIPLAAGGLAALACIGNGLIGMLAPLTLIFYGLALHSAGNFTYRELRFLGMMQVVLGLLSMWHVAYSLLYWAVGFGIMHIVYGVYIYWKYER
jgi:hypothetical protein